MFDRKFLAEDLELQIKAVPLLEQYSRHNIYFKIWWDKTKNLLERLYGPESQTLKKFCSIKFGHRKLNTEGKDYTQKARKAYLSGLQKAQELLLESVNSNLQTENCCIFKNPGSTFKLRAAPEELNISVLLNLQELRTHLAGSGLPEEVQNIVYKEIDDFMQSLSAKKLNAEKIIIFRNRLENLIDLKIYKVGALFILYHISLLLEGLTCAKDM